MHAHLHICTPAIHLQHLHARIPAPLSLQALQPRLEDSERREQRARDSEASLARQLEHLVNQNSTLSTDLVAARARCAALQATLDNRGGQGSPRTPPQHSATHDRVAGLLSGGGSVGRRDSVGSSGGRGEWGR